MKKPPCIRSIPKFKKGCPQRPWDGEVGCTAWIEKELPDDANPNKKVMVRQCLDLWMFKLGWDANSIAVGNQQAVESFRNNMTTDGKPKPDPALVHIANMMEGRLSQLPEK